MKLFIYSMFLFSFFVSCVSSGKKNQLNTSKELPEKLPYLTFQKENLFPGDGSLLRPEDGVALVDGRVIVADQAKGLRLIEKDGSNRPFGNFNDAGFVYNPPDKISSPNGLHLEHDGRHLLMCDFTDGKIYRIDLASEKVEFIYDHSFGVNAIYRDKTGAIWFTQSDKGSNRIDRIDSPVPNGVIFRMADFKSIPEIIADSLYLANGITMDRDEKTLYVAETLMNRVHSFEVDITTGKTVHAGIVAMVIAPDNILVDRGRLFIASPGSNQVIAIDLKNHSQHLVFDASTRETRKIADEWFRRSQLGLKRAQIINAKMHGSLPGLLTGMFFSKDGRTLYIANLGKDIVKVDFK